MPSQLKKVSTGIKGLDEVTGGGLPAGRATLLCGGPGCGKTLLLHPLSWKALEMASLPYS